MVKNKDTNETCKKCTCKPCISSAKKCTRCLVCDGTYPKTNPCYKN